MADRFEQLKIKYQSVFNFIQSQGVHAALVRRRTCQADKGWENATYG